MVAHQEHQPPAHTFGQGQGRPRQGAANALPLAFGINRQRPEEKRRQRIQPQRPEPYGAHQGPVGAGDVAKLGQRRQAVAIAIGGLAPTVRAEGAIEQGFNPRAVGGPFRSDQEHGRGPRSTAGYSVTRGR